MDILDKIKQANLVGRGGACFPTALKWEAVKNASGEKKYVVINCSEGEPGVQKDAFILENYPERVLEGLELARDFLSGAKIYFYINPEIYNRLKNKQLKIFSKLGEADKFEFFVKPEGAGYIGGEETALLNALEGKKIEPRLKPPFPTTRGLFGRPTLINNVETFYNVALVERGEFYDFRFYTVNGPVPNPGVYSYPAKWTIKMVLDESKNYPAFPFFVQVGGDAAGEVLASPDLDRLTPGAASITVYDLNKTQPEKLLRYWLNFFRKNSCGQCTPCREGTYRLLEILDKKPVAWPVFADLLDDLETTSFCALGCSVPAPVKSYVKNILNNDIKNLKIN
jgi:NADH:ubiquinone oxidoreductase subunit F (NADH-binding)